MANRDGESAEPVLEVSQFYESLITHIESSFGRRSPRWVRGEIEKCYEKGHLYLDVVDASPVAESQRPVLKVRCWSSVWTPLKRDLAARGVTLTEGLVVNFRGYAGVYKPRGEIGFSVTEIDIEGALGDVARRRQLLIEQLQREGALEVNRSLPTPPVPLRVGLVSSPKSEGHNDFVGQLVHSGFAFRVTGVPTTVQGDDAPAEIIRALQQLNDADVDVICVVRGGGSRGDLGAFDDERVARAIVASRRPVYTGVGHTGDVAVADLVAAHAAITPTKLGEHLVSQVAEWRTRHVVRPAERVVRFSTAIVEEATEYVGERRRTVMLAVRDRLGTESVRLEHTRHRLERHALHLMASEQQRLSATRALLAAYDPQRRLAQGWSILTDHAGAVVKSVQGVTVGDALVARVSDGTIDLAVRDVQESGHD